MESQLSDDNLDWADAVIMVYDVGDERSFDYTLHAIESMRNKQSRDHVHSTKPVLLLGNKTDIIVSYFISLVENFAAP